MNPVHRIAGWALAGIVTLLVLSGCSSDEQSDGTATDTPSATVAAACEDGVAQDPMIDFRPDSSTTEEIDAGLGLNYNAEGAPCLDVFVWDHPKGWKLDHYAITGDLGVEGTTTVSSTDDDFVTGLRFIVPMSCAKITSEIVYTQRDRSARFTADTLLCARRGPIDPED